MLMIQAVGVPLYSTSKCNDEDDDDDFNQSVDVFAFRIILREVISRQPPTGFYKGCSVIAVMREIKENKRPLIPFIVNKKITDLIWLCWDSNPSTCPGFDDILKQLDAADYKVMPGMVFGEVCKFVREIEKQEVACI